MIKQFKEKFFSMDFGFQMIYVCVSILISNQLLSYTTSLMNKPNTILVNVGLLLTLGLFVIQLMFLMLGVMSVRNYIKKPKQNNINNNEQSN